MLPKLKNIVTSPGVLFLIPCLFLFSLSLQSSSLWPAFSGIVCLILGITLSIGLSRSNVLVAFATILFIIGLFLIYIATGSFILFFILVYGGIVSIIIGVSLLFFSKKSNTFKLIAIGIPLLIAGFIIKDWFATPETILIPEGYKGYVYIIYDQKEGQSKEYENFGLRRVYRIPSTGVLFTSFKPEKGITNQKFYYISPKGKRIKLDIDPLEGSILSDSDPAGSLRNKTSIFPYSPEPILLGVDTNRLKPEYWLSEDRINQQEVTSFQFFVGSYNDLEKFEALSPFTIDSLRINHIKNQTLFKN